LLTVKRAAEYALGMALNCPEFFLDMDKEGERIDR